MKGGNWVGIDPRRRILSPSSRAALEKKNFRDKKREFEKNKRGWIEISELWEDIKNNRISISGKSSGKEFEYIIVKGFELSGADVRCPYEVRLEVGINEQIDGVVYAGGVSFMVEAKDYGESKVNIEPIAKLRNQLIRRHSSVIGLFFSKTGYTAPALTLSHFLGPQAIILWDFYDVEYSISRKDFLRPLNLKLRKMVELGMPWYDLRESELP